MYLVVRYYSPFSVQCADLSLLKQIIDNRRDPTAFLITADVNQVLHVGIRQMARQTVVRQTGTAENVTVH